MTTIAQKLSLHSLPCRSNLSQHELQLTSFNSTLQNREQCVLLRLPPELRNAVYQYVFQEDDIEICAPIGENTNSDSHTHYPRQNLQLLGTCRQIYTEARLLPFASNTFKGGHWALRRITRLLSRDQADAISTVYIVIDDYHFSFAMDVSKPAHSFENLYAPARLVLRDTLLSTLERLARLPELKQILLSPWQYEGNPWKQIWKNGWAEDCRQLVVEALRQQTTRRKEIKVRSLVEE